MESSAAARLTSEPHSATLPMPLKAGMSNSRSSVAIMKPPAAVPAKNRYMATHSPQIT